MKFISFLRRDARETARPFSRRMAVAALLVLCALARPSVVSAHLVTIPGDVALVGIHTSSSGPRSFAFLVLAPFTPGESVAFTDNGWRAAGGFASGEGEIVWDVDRPGQLGTVVVMPGTTGVSLEPGADQVFALARMTGEDGGLSEVLVHGLNLGGPWHGDAISPTTSARAPALVGYDVALGPFLDCAYSGSTVGTRAQLLARISDPSQWTCSDTVRPAYPARFTVLGALGDRCSSDASCGAGLCAHGVCCNTECRRDEPWHCESCDFGPGDPRTGTCGPASTLTLCRTARGPCDPADMCDGVSRECPVNRPSGPELVCRASRGGCDPAERCDGSAATCPTDTIAEAGAVCRASRGSCDPEEVCTGLTECPVDVTVADETACDDGLACSATSSCIGGACLGPVPAECDDEDACTVDSCRDPEGCSNTTIAGCCTRDDQCDDGDACTVDACTDMRCAVAPIAMCGDAGASADAGMDAGAAPEAGLTPGEPAMGCGCRVSAARRPSLSAIIALLVVAGALFRRRR